MHIEIHLMCTIHTKGMILIVTNGVVIVLVSCSTAMIRLSALEEEELISCGATRDKLLRQHGS